MLRSLWERRWFQQATGIFSALVVAVGLALAAYFSGYFMLARSMWGVGLMAVQFILGLTLIRTMLSPGHPILGVARTLVDEAVRMKVALVLIILLLILVPLLPSMLDARERLAYRISTFITYSMIVASLLLSLMTVFLACGTIAYELRERQIFLSMTKPVSRGQYLLGKWLGIVLLNALLLSVAGTGIYTFANTLREHGRPIDEADRLIVDEEVLVARASARPMVPEDMRQAIEREYERAKEEYPDFLLNMSPDEARQTIGQTMVAMWHTLPPNINKAYRFTDLSRVAQHSDVVHLRIRPRSFNPPATGQLNLILRINGRVAALPPIANDAVYRVPIDAQLISEQGELLVEIRNQHPAGPQHTHNASIQFTPGDGLELLYPVDTFAANLSKGVFVLWVRLCCLAMLGLAAATFLGFPIASMLTLMIYIAAASSGFIAESLLWYAPVGVHEDAPLAVKISAHYNAVISMVTQLDVGSLIRLIFKGIAALFMGIVPAFGELDPVPMVSDGRNVPGAMVWDAVWQVGIVWTALVGFVGWQIFRRRELARVIV